MVRTKKDIDSFDVEQLTRRPLTWIGTSRKK